ncbi:MAG: histidine phosphatase family protein, partial [Anaerolineae bacterium]|nr:histidine phosphatase family protein [Anaerolineae bacterium]
MGRLTHEQPGAQSLNLSISNPPPHVSRITFHAPQRTTTLTTYTHNFYLVRHGENPANITKEFSYRDVDYSLTPKGVLQAQQTAAHFRNVPVDAVVASPLKRTRETAAIIAD